MPSKAEVIEDMLAQVEEEFHKVLTRENYPNFFGGKVQITYTTAPRLTIEIAEAKRSGPKTGQKFRKRVGPSKAAMKAMREDSSEEFLQ
jgi:hypothetical protein